MTTAAHSTGIGSVPKTADKLTLTADQKDLLRGLTATGNATHKAMLGITKCIKQPERYPGQLETCIKREADMHRSYKQNLKKLTGNRGGS